MGDFTFADDGVTASSSSSSTDDEEEDEVEAMLSISGEANPDYMTLYLYADNTYTFVSTLGANMSESGTWSYDEDTQTITLFYEDESQAATATAEDGVLYFQYVYSAQTALTQYFTISVDELTAAIAAAQS